MALLPINFLLVTNVGPQEQALVPVRKASILLTNLAFFYRAHFMILSEYHSEYHSA